MPPGAVTAAARGRCPATPERGGRWDLARVVPQQVARAHVRRGYAPAAAVRGGQVDARAGDVQDQVAAVHDEVRAGHALHAGRGRQVRAAIQAGALGAARGGGEQEEDGKRAGRHAQTSAAARVQGCDGARTAPLGCPGTRPGGAPRRPGRAVRRGEREAARSVDRQLALKRGPAGPHARPGASRAGRPFGRWTSVLAALRGRCRCPTARPPPGRSSRFGRPVRTARPGASRAGRPLGR